MLGGIKTWKCVWIFCIGICPVHDVSLRNDVVFDIWWEFWFYTGWFYGECDRDGCWEGSAADITFVIYHFRIHCLFSRSCPCWTPLWLLEHWLLSDFVNSHSPVFLKIWRIRELLVLAFWNKSELKSLGLLETNYHFGLLHSPGGWWKSQSANKQTNKPMKLEL